VEYTGKDEEDAGREKLKGRPLMLNCGYVVNEEQSQVIQRHMVLFGCVQHSAHTHTLTISLFATHNKAWTPESL
jgi:hypothetical protein